MGPIGQYGRLSLTCITTGVSCFLSFSCTFHLPAANLRGVSWGKRGGRVLIVGLDVQEDRRRCLIQVMCRAKTITVHSRMINSLGL